MLEQLLEIDVWLFKLLNGSWHNAFFDTIMPVWREKTTWIPLYILLIIFIFKKMGRMGIILLLGAILSAGLADTASSKIIKPQVARLRPCNDNVLKPQTRLLMKNCGSGYSFTSSHATNHFALAVFLMFALMRASSTWLKVSLLLWAASIAYGQVYVGVHYPFDVLCGAILGSTIGFCCFLFYDKIMNSINKPASIRT